MKSLNPFLNHLRAQQHILKFVRVINYHVMHRPVVWLVFFVGLHCTNIIYYNYMYCNFIGHWCMYIIYFTIPTIYAIVDMQCEDE